MLWGLWKLGMKLIVLERMLFFFHHFSFFFPVVSIFRLFSMDYSSRVSIRLAPQDALCTTLREDLLNPNGTCKTEPSAQIMSLEKNLPLPNRAVLLLVPMKDVPTFSFSSSWSRSILCQDLFVTSWIKQLTKGLQASNFPVLFGPQGLECAQIIQALGIKSVVYSAEVWRICWDLNDDEYNVNMNNMHIYIYCIHISTNIIISEYEYTEYIYIGIYWFIWIDINIYIHCEYEYESKTQTRSLKWKERKLSKVIGVTNPASFLQETFTTKRLVPANI